MHENLSEAKIGQWNEFIIYNMSRLKLSSEREHEFKVFIVWPQMSDSPQVAP